MNECVQSEDPECQVGQISNRDSPEVLSQVGIGMYGQDLQLSFFCGSHEDCLNSTNRNALQMAKYNVENRFKSIG